MSGFTIVVILILVMFASLAIFVLQADESELTAKSPAEDPRSFWTDDDEMSSPEMVDGIASPDGGEETSNDGPGTAQRETSEPEIE